MCIQLHSFLILGFVVLVVAYRTETVYFIIFPNKNLCFTYKFYIFQWPPAALLNQFDVMAIRNICINRCPGENVLKDMEFFEKTTDINNLPKNRELKCYINCVMTESNTIFPNSTRINMENMINVLDKLSKDDQYTIIAMSRGCVKRTMHIRDSIEYTYILNVCAKQNDPEVRN